MGGENKKHKLSAKEEEIYKYRHSSNYIDNHFECEFTNR
jgi:hypothetical protein